MNLVARTLHTVPKDLFYKGFLFRWLLKNSLFVLDPIWFCLQTLYNLSLKGVCLWKKLKQYFFHLRRHSFRHHNFTIHTLFKINKKHSFNLLTICMYYFLKNFSGFAGGLSPRSVLVCLVSAFFNCRFSWLNHFFDIIIYILTYLHTNKIIRYIIFTWAGCLSNPVSLTRNSKSFGFGLFFKKGLENLPLFFSHIYLFM